MQNWNSYKNQIMAMDSFADESTALATMEKAIDKVYRLERIIPLSVETKSSLEQLWSEAFINLKDKIILQEFKWQRELAVHLVYLLSKLRK